MEQVLQIAQEHVHWAPYIFFLLLLMAGLNVPVSEDLLLFTGGVLASEYPTMLVPIYLGLFTGAYLSDLMVYWIFGRYLGQKIKDHPIILRSFPPKKIKKVAYFLHRYGSWTLIIGRFIPFGVRNVLFFVCGLTHMKAVSFSVIDAIACFLSTGIYFGLYFYFGDQIISTIKTVNLTIFVIFIGVILALVIGKKYFPRRSKDSAPIDLKLD